MAITLEQYLMGRDKQYPEHYSEEIEKAAKELLERVNKLLDILEIGAVRVSSGWRPAPVNKKVGGATGSAHLTGEAVDIADQNRFLAKMILRNPTILDRCDLYFEAPEHTRVWCHLQSRPTKSGKRIFAP